MSPKLMGLVVMDGVSRREVDLRQALSRLESQVSRVVDLTDSPIDAMA